MKASPPIKRLRDPPTIGCKLQMEISTSLEGYELLNFPKAGNPMSSWLGYQQRPPALGEADRVLVVEHSFHRDRLAAIHTIEGNAAALLPHCQHSSVRGEDRKCITATGLRQNRRSAPDPLGVNVPVIL